LRRGAKKERCSDPKGEFRGPSAGAIDSSLRFYNNIVHTLLGIRLTQAGLRGNQSPARAISI
jgi:hypothetical protein